MKILIKNGRVIDTATNFDKITSLAIENGKLAHIENIPQEFIPDRTIDAKDCLVTPGLVDSCNRPQMQHPQGSTLLDEAQAALKNGFTALCIPPDGEPVLDNTASVFRLIQQSNNLLPTIYPIGALTSQLGGETIADLTTLHHAGCIAFSNAQRPIANTQMLRHCYDYAASFNLPVVVSPLCPMLSLGGVAHEGQVATRLGLAGIPVIAETTAISQHLQLMQDTNVRGHFTCLSSMEAVALIREAKAKGLAISADTAMHQLHLTEMDVADFNANCHLYPPLRSQRDKDALIEGIGDGTIDAICSDHRPLEPIAKLAPFADTLPGLSAMDTYLSLGLHLVNQSKIALHTLIGAMTYRPAKIFNLPIGSMALGQRADICIINPNIYWNVDSQNLHSKAKNTPFIGWELPGRVTHTILNGHVVHEI